VICDREGIQPAKKTTPLKPERFSGKTDGGRKQWELANPGSPGKRLLNVMTIMLP